MSAGYPPQAQPAAERRRHILLALGLFAGLWWVISGGSSGSWLIGLLAVALAVWASRRLHRPSGVRISGLGLLKFAPFFLWESLRGGIDVALRTLSPRMRIEPGFLRYRTQLQSEPARILFANCVSLLPGTLASDLRQDWLEIHSLNLADDPQRELVRLERMIEQLMESAGGRR